MEASQADKNTYGDDVKLHPITNMPLESGIGHMPDDMQAWAHCDVIEREKGSFAAAAMRARLTEAAKNPEPPALTRAKLKAEKAATEADEAKAMAEAKAKIAEVAKANVETVRKELADEAKPVPLAPKPAPAPSPFPVV